VGPVALADHLTTVGADSVGTWGPKAFENTELWAEDDPGPFNLAMHDLLERLNLAPSDASKREPPKKKPVMNRSPCAIG
jgi:hypothetical protein